MKGDFGPFKVNNRVQVPLWVAVYLKKLNKCRIYAPNWLTLDYLKGIKESEVSNKELTQMPEYYYEIA
jgi:GINS complex subunit 2